jgi:hypothetical protein
MPATGGGGWVPTAIPTRHKTALIRIVGVDASGVLKLMTIAVTSGFDVVL